MLFAEAFTGSQTIGLGLLILLTGLLLRRSARLGRRSRNRDPQAEARREILKAEQTTVSMIRKLKVDLHDYDREIEGRIETRIAVLEKLVGDADDEMVRMQSLLSDLPDQGDAVQRLMERRAGALGQPYDEGSAEEGKRNASGRATSPEESVRSGEPSKGTVTPEERRTVVDLHGIGFRPDEIARYLDRPTSEVLSILNDRGQPGRMDAA